ncbi:transcription initiation factor TFIID subunit 7-like [Anneissia japonica]|uniref:transcription initiation factor TFIID subunit 7-like n=1 Tax=Anneissia japonica TaxID=1529436 RepID=UPI001425BB2F|nr:transcription initiation factor TFIID subunit 7-like [Anneissia japonica]
MRKLVKCSYLFFFNAKAYGHVYKEMADMAQYSLTKKHSLLKLVDIPTILESYKTVDKKTFFKTADICQMLGCSNEGEDSGSGREEKVLHTRTPTKSTRSFYGTMDYIESPDIEKEVKRLLRMDSTAIRIRWEVLPDKDGKEDTKSELQIDSNDWKQIFEDHGGRGFPARHGGVQSTKCH